MRHCQASHARYWTKNAACSIEVLLVCGGAACRRIVGLSDERGFFLKPKKYYFSSVQSDFA